MLLNLFLAFFFSKTAVSYHSSTPYPPAHISINWTSCEAFVNNTVFDPASVLDVDWKIFYFWNPEIEASYNIRFSRSTDVLVDRFRVGLEAETLTVNWSDAELFMESSIDFSALFLKTNVSGIYRIIPGAAFDFTSLPMLIFGLKVVKPGYLGIANCKYRLCYGLAPVEKMPGPHELEEAALSLGFYSEYNRTHAIEAPDLSADQAVHVQEDDDDEDLDVDLDPNRLDLF